LQRIFGRNARTYLQNDAETRCSVFEIVFGIARGAGSIWKGEECLSIVGKDGDGIFAKYPSDRTEKRGSEI
jgi:hypothetical protein